MLADVKVEVEVGLNNIDSVGYNIDDVDVGGVADFISTLLWIKQMKWMIWLMGGCKMCVRRGWFYDVVDVDVHMVIP